MNIYCSHPIMGQDGPPDWVMKLQDNFASNTLGLKFYHPWEGIISQAGRLKEWLEQPPNEHALRFHEIFKLDPMLFAAFTDHGIVQRFKHGDSGPNFDVPFKDLYMLIRADLMLVDMCNPSYGGTSQEVLYGYLLDIPIVGITDRFINSPWIQGKVKAVCTPRTSNDILQLIFSFSPQAQLMMQGIRSVREQKKPAEVEVPKPKEEPASPEPEKK